MLRLNVRPRRPGAADARRVSEVMVTIPKTMPVATTVAQAIDAFADPHVHMLLIAEDGVLLGTLVREDLDPEPPAATPAVAVSALHGRVVPPERFVAEALLDMQQQGLRRLAVVDVEQRLLGLLCLKRNLTGFCTDQGIAARAAERERSGAGTRPGAPRRASSTS